MSSGGRWARWLRRDRFLVMVPSPRGPKLRPGSLGTRRSRPEGIGRRSFAIAAYRVSAGDGQKIEGLLRAALDRGPAWLVRGAAGRWRANGHDEPKPRLHLGGYRVCPVGGGGGGGGGWGSGGARGWVGSCACLHSSSPQHEKECHSRCSARDHRSIRSERLCSMYQRLGVLQAACAAARSVELVGVVRHPCVVTE